MHGCIKAIRSVRDCQQKSSRRQESSLTVQDLSNAFEIATELSCPGVMGERDGWNLCLNPRLAGIQAPSRIHADLYSRGSFLKGIMICFLSGSANATVC